MPEGPERDADDRSASAEEIEAERQQVLAAGGLFVLGTERHESRRIDNQLRGRSGRQGDPGLSRFYLSLDDDLLRIFGPQTAVRAADEQEPRGRRGDRQPVDLQGDRDRAEEGRGAQLRHPQAGRRIRRRDERPAQGDLRAARRHHGRRHGRRRGRGHARRDRRQPRSSARLPAGHLSRAVGRRRPQGQVSPRSSASTRRSTTG